MKEMVKCQYPNWSVYTSRNTSFSVFLGNDFLLEIALKLDSLLLAWTSTFTTSSSSISEFSLILILLLKSERKLDQTLQKSVSVICKK